nr:phosphate/phosphite/phosphonate ABC transporter substrate-binding protein [Shouchella shacheensis]
MKKKLAGSTLVAFSTLALVACGGGNDEETNGNGDNGEEASGGGYVPEELTVQFVPSQNAETLEARAKPLEDLLEDEIDIPVTVSVSTNYTSVVEAMASEQIDVGFLPPTAYVQAKEMGAAEVILQSQRYGVNEEDGSETDELVDGYKAQFVAMADSEYDSIEDLEGATIGFQDVSSSAGYIWPAASMMDAGIDPQTDVNPVNLTGHDAGIIAVLNGDVDVAATFQDARNTVEGDFPDVFEDTKIIGTTEFIPNDTISVRSDMDPEWMEKIQQAFITIGESEEGREIIYDVYTHQGYVESDDSNFDIVRDYEERVTSE